MKVNSWQLFFLCLLLPLLAFPRVVLSLSESDLDKLYTDPPQAKRYKIGYVLDKTSITKKGDKTYNIRISVVTKERTATMLMDVNCRNKTMASGCTEMRDADTGRLLKKSSECSAGYGPFKTPQGDTRHVVDAFCKRYDKESTSGQQKPSDAEIREFFAKCMKDYGSSKTCRGETRLKYGISDKEVWLALGLREGEF